MFEIILEKYERMTKYFPKCTCFGLLKSNSSIKIATLFIILVYILEFIIYYCIYFKFNSRLPVIFNLILFYCGLHTKNEGGMIFIMAIGAYTLPVFLGHCCFITSSVMHFQHASENYYINLFRMRLNRINFNADKYTDDDMIHIIKIFYIARFFYYIFISCVSLIHYFASQYYVNCFKEKEEEEEFKKRIKY
eukprot:jgi/Orpsp1_1/1179727/evm.model.c7180000070545.1